MRPDLTRRRLLAGIAAAIASAPTYAGKLLATPRQSEGPFYPPEPPLDDDNDLTRVRGREGIAKGDIAEVGGRLLDLNGRPLEGVRVEIWQCDTTGRYHHPRDGGEGIDLNFQGFGHTSTDGEGRYRFRTIRPVPYPGRTPHIHFAVLPKGAQRFTTQLYIKDEPLNERDFLFNFIPAERRKLVLAEFKPARGDTKFRARFDIVLAGADGTPSTG